MYLDGPRLVGLGSRIFQPDEMEAILLEMGWDGTVVDENGASVPYRLTKQWLEQTLQNALQSALDKQDSKTNPPTQGE